MISVYGNVTPEGVPVTSVISTGNSTTTPLGISGVFTGTWEDMSGYDSVSVVISTDQTGTVAVQFSPDGINVDSTLSHNIGPNDNTPRRLTILRKYCRIVITNGATAQTYLRAQVLKGDKQLLTSPLNSSMGEDVDAIVVKNISEETLTVEGKYSSRFIVNKFGFNPDIDTTSVPEDIWNGGGTYTGFPTGSAETVDVYSSDTNDTSAGTGLRTVRLFGLDANYELQTEDITLNGTTNVTSSNTWMRVNRQVGLTAGSAGTNVGTITVQHTTTTANVFTVMPAGYGQSQTTGYTIPAGYTGYLKHFEASMFDTSVTNSAVMVGWVREFNGVVRLLRKFTISNTNSFSTDIYGGLELLEKTDLIMRVINVDNNNASISGSYVLLLVENY